MLEPITKNNESIVELLDKISSSLENLERNPGFLSAEESINNVIALLGVQGEWRLFSDTRRRIYNKAHLFHLAQGFKDKRATYKIVSNNGKNIDLKAFWVKKKNRSVLSWLSALTPNFEDEPFNTKYNVGIDFMIPGKADGIIIVLSKNYALRVLELKGPLGSTQQEILSQWTNLDFSNKKKLHHELWESFNLQPINKQFYNGICEHFDKLRNFLHDKQNFPEKEAVVFTMRLIGRVVFCWFLKKKGFIKKPEYYLSIQDHQSDKDYYYNIFSSLLFDILNEPVGSRKAEHKSIAPYLNGGLFSLHSSDDPCFLKWDFPKGFFKGFYDFLKMYNFTTDESTSAFEQVAIDPEMLGKIFENLLAEQREETGKNARKAKGTYYTPREIVDYMCKESMRAYLKNELPDNKDVDECLEKLIDTSAHEFNDQKSNYQRDYFKRYKNDLLKALQKVRILDPACGSGAFPMGMIQTILGCYERLESNGLSKRKKDLIENNIYGVDIDPMAIEISKLRIWLSLIIDGKTDKNNLPVLPNLEFKFVCANTLMDFSGAKREFDNLDEIRGQYFELRDAQKKRKFQKEIKLKFSCGGFSFDPFNYSNSCDFFDANIMLGVKEGFNVIIGNPPYIKEHTNRSAFDGLRESPYYKGKMEYMVFFSV